MRTLILLPTFNEILNIESMLRALREVVPDANILVVDDGSPDGTARIAKRLADELSQIWILERSTKSGLGGAYRAGFSWGLERDYDTFVEIDCDFSHDPLGLPTLIAARQNAEVVIGSRYVTGGKIPRWSFSRRLLSRGGNRYASIMLALNVNDSTSGYRVYTKSALQKIEFLSCSADGYGFQIEMTHRARKNGASIIEVPIIFSDRELGESKMSWVIVAEAVWLVTKWAAQRPFDAYFSKTRMSGV